MYMINKEEEKVQNLKVAGCKREEKLRAVLQLT